MYVFQWMFDAFVVRVGDVFFLVRWDADGRMFFQHVRKFALHLGTYATADWLRWKPCWRTVAACRRMGNIASKGI